MELSKLSVAKARLQSRIRRVHALYLFRGLPTKVGVYFHDVPPDRCERLAEVVSYFRREGYRFVEPGEFLTDPSEPCVFVSFDDCYRSWYEALPFLSSLSVPLTFYVNSCCLRDRATPEEIDAYFDRLEYLGPRVPLSADELRALAGAGFTIGAHTRSHTCLTRLTLSEARREIELGKQDLEEVLGSTVRHFSYPFGLRRHFSPSLRRFCREIGFETVANAVPGAQHRPQHPYALNRSGWNLERGFSYNLINLGIDGRIFERLTGRSPVI